MSSNSADQNNTVFGANAGRKSNIFRPFILKTGGKTEMKLVIGGENQVLQSPLLRLSEQQKRKTDIMREMDIGFLGVLVI